jgi:hypothetical protein
MVEYVLHQYGSLPIHSNLFCILPRVNMESPTSRNAELLSLNSSRLPIGPPPAATPHYVIATQDITADRESPLGTPRRAGSVYKGFWNNSLVAVKVLSNDTSLDVGRLSCLAQHGPIMLIPNCRPCINV